MITLSITLYLSGMLLAGCAILDGASGAKKSFGRKIVVTASILVWPLLAPFALVNALFEAL